MTAPAALLRCVPECCSAPARTLVCRRPSGSPVMETTSSPRFLGHPLRICPALRPRPGCHAKPFRHSSAAPADLTTKAPAIKFLSRLNHTASAVAVYASPGGRPRQTQDSLPAADYALPGGIGYPQGGYERFLMLVSHLPPPPGLAWRDRSQTERFCGVLGSLSGRRRAGGDKVLRSAGGRDCGGRQMGNAPLG